MVRTWPTARQGEAMHRNSRSVDGPNAVSYVPSASCCSAASSARPSARTTLPTARRRGPFPQSVRRLRGRLGPARHRPRFRRRHRDSTGTSWAVHPPRPSAAIRTSIKVCGSRLEASTEAAVMVASRSRTGVSAGTSLITALLTHLWLAAAPIRGPHSPPSAVDGSKPLGVTVATRDEPFRRRGAGSQY